MYSCPVGRYCWSHYYPLSRCITQSNKTSGHVPWNPNTETNHYASSMRSMTLKGFHTSASETERSACACVCVCLQCPAGSPLTLGPTLENQARVTADSTQSALCVQTVETSASSLCFDSVIIWKPKVFNIKQKNMS